MFIIILKNIRVISFPLKIFDDNLTSHILSRSKYWISN